jgi:hypothetical protein
VNCAATHFIQRIAVPPAVHVGFSETERPRSQDPVKEMPVMHLNVPGARASDANVGAREKIGHYVLGSGHNDLAGRERFVPIRRIAPAAMISLIERKMSVGGRIQTFNIRQQLSS